MTKDDNKLIWWVFFKSIQVEGNANIEVVKYIECCNFELLMQTHTLYTFLERKGVKESILSIKSY